MKDIDKIRNLTRINKIDIGGHFKSGQGLSDRTAKFVRDIIGPYIYRGNGEWMEINPPCPCSQCGEFMELKTNGKEVLPRTQCPYPNGVPPTVFELNIPSGKMIVANDLRKLFPVLGDYDVNSNLGKQQSTLAYAAAGMAHAFVSNTCPGVYRCTNEQFVIGQAGKTNPKAFGAKRSISVAGICTDLWWYSICDFDEFTKRGGKKDSFVDIVKCVPGVYRFTHNYDSWDDEGPVIYTHIEKIRNPDPIQDYSAAYNALNITAGQVLARSLGGSDYYARVEARAAEQGQDYPAIQQAANHLLCSYGNGAEYHPNGFWAYDPDIHNDMPSVEIPVFDAPYNWSDMCGYSAIAEMVGVDQRHGSDIVDKVNDSFLELAFNICQCIYRHGSNGANNVRTEKVVKECLIALLEKYPQASFVETAGRYPMSLREIVDKIKHDK